MSIRQEKMIITTEFGMGFGGYIWMIIIWAIIIGGGIGLLAALFPRTSTSADGETGLNDNPLTILKQRYVRGELSTEEFEAIRRDIEQA